jgi:hypothetical protein
VKTRALVAFSFILISAILGGVAYAHHSQAGFETPDKAKALKGTVVEYRWRNPHVLRYDSPCRRHHEQEFSETR